MDGIIVSVSILEAVFLFSDAENKKSRLCLVYHPPKVAYRHALGMYIISREVAGCFICRSDTPNHAIYCIKVRITNIK